MIPEPHGRDSDYTGCENHEPSKPRRQPEADRSQANGESFSNVARRETSISVILMNRAAHPLAEPEPPERVSELLL